MFFSRPVCLLKYFWGAENVPEGIKLNFAGTVLVGLYQLYESSCKTEWLKSPEKHASLPCCCWPLLSAFPHTWRTSQQLILLLASEFVSVGTESWSTTAAVSSVSCSVWQLGWSIRTGVISFPLDLHPFRGWLPFRLIFQYRYYLV